ncbi:MAG TPA: IPT/TIG domain-containing protein [Solirubrobacteraceae bacterium]|nr:IPT/TIG domain-containing protein [Solirubrobacteraceae bacterium]
MRRWRWLLVVAGVLLGVVGLTSSASAGAPAPVRVAPASTLPSGAAAAGAVSASTAIAGAVVLAPRDPAALKTFIAAVSDKRSPQFGQYLAPGQFASRFGPTAAALAGVRAQLRRDGLRVASTSRDGLIVPFTGSASKVQRAFSTRLERVRLASGAIGRAATTAIHVPATIAPAVTTVIGLSSLSREQPSDLRHASQSQIADHVAAKTSTFPHPAGSPTPCSAATAAAVHNDGLTDDQIANAYGAFGLYGAGDLGAGQHIALYENEQFARSDIRTFDTCYFGAKRAAQMLSRLHVHSVDGGQPAGPGSGEASLDVEDVSAMAPGATIDVYEGPFTGDNSEDYDSLDEYTAIIDADQDQIVSTSWGLCEQSIEQGQTGLEQAENILFEQAAAQGQTVFDAAGDNGEDDCNVNETPNVAPGQNPVSVEDPSTQPYVVSVGGTAISDASSSPPAEQVWNDGPDGGAGGGGISQAWEMPSWQQDATVPGIDLPGSAAYKAAAAIEQQYGFPTNFCQATIPGATASTPCRLVPDVAAQADEYTGSVTVYSAEYAGFYPGHGWTTTGGTSSAAPIWAAMLADVNASAACAGSTTTARGVGFASPLLYEVASNPAEYAASFHDITTGNNDLYDLSNGQVFPATTGYDLATGLGSPELTGPNGVDGLAYYLCTAAGAGGGTRPTVTGLSPASGSTAGGETVKITGTGFVTGGTDQVSGVQVGGFPLPASSIDVTGPTTIRIQMPPAVKTLPPDSPAPQDGAGPANVVVTLTDDQSNATTAASMYEYVDESSGPVPSVSGISATGGLRSAPAAVTILGSGFTGATRVTFGGVAASSFHVDNDNRITVTPPAYSSATSCAPLPTSGVYAGESANNDLCQALVRVGNANGFSATAPIPVPYEGTFTTNSLGDTVLPAGCGCEGVPAPDEYDYLPQPVITSVSTSSGPANLASESGDTLITIHGSGFSPLAIDWANFGPPDRERSIDTDYQFVSGTEIQIVAPAQAKTVTPFTVPVSVRTLAGQSAPATVTYAGIPKVTSVTNPQNAKRLDGVPGASDLGGTPITIRGQGFADQLTGPIQFTDTGDGPSSGTQYTYQVVSGGQVTTTTPQINPGLDDVQLCTVSGCSKARGADELWLYQPGDPQVSAVNPASGPAAGGTSTRIDGTNLGCPLQVYFGSTVAASFSAVQADSDCGATVEVKATSPAGSAGTEVPVRVRTVESYFTGSGRGTTTAEFSYTQ